MVFARLVRLAYRNLGRNRRRTVLTVAAIAFGLTMVQLMIGIQEGSYAEMTRQAVSAFSGHVVVQEQGYAEREDSDIVVTGTSAVVDRIRQAVPDAIVAPRLMLGGLLTSPHGSAGVALVGLDPVAEAEVQHLDEKVVEGEWLSGDGRSVVLGEELARTLGVELGDKVVYMGQHNGATEVSSRLFRVAGTFRTGATELDAFGAFVDLAAAQEAFGQPDVSNRVTVHLKDPDTADAVAATLKDRLGDRSDLAVLTWREAMPELYALIRLDRSTGNVMLVILGLIVAMGVLNTVLMSVLERTREFGVMLSIGLKPTGLAATILLEGVTIGVLGAVIGTGVGLLATWPLVVHGLDYSGFIGSDTMETGGVAISAVIHAAFEPTRTATYALGTIFFTALAAVYPASYVARLEPVDAMRHV
ncbi:MAG: ABC transporter permease [Myxococcota bacterium]